MTSYHLPDWAFHVIWPCIVTIGGFVLKVIRTLDALKRDVSELKEWRKEVSKQGDSK